MKSFVLTACFFLCCGAARAAGPLVDGLTPEEAKRVEAAYDEVRKTPEMREAIETYNAARKAYLDDRQKFPADRDPKASLNYRKASKVFEAVTGKALIAKDASLAPLVEKATAFKYRPRTRNEGETIADSDDPRNKAMRPIKDEPGLPRVLLIGDSISIGYTPEVRELLKGKANVHRISQNGGATDVGLDNMKKWLGDGKWDVIHFNFGLHDAKYASATSLRTPLDEYGKNLQTLVKQMNATGAKLIFATTTPVPKDGKLQPGRIFDNIPARNEVALKVMRENGVAIDDLYSVVLPVQAEVGRENDVHFEPAGYSLLAKAVAASIVKELPKK